MTSHPSAPARPRLSRGSMIAAAAAVLLVVAMAWSTTYWPADQPIPGQQVAFDPAAYARDNYTGKIVPAITANPVNLLTLVADLTADKAKAGQTYGKRDGSSPWTFSVTATGVAGPPANGLLPITVPGLPEGTRVSVQIGPAINGTALRDATGTVRFNDFVNQVEYSDAAIALNDAMKTDLLAGLDAATLVGKNVTVVGATAPLNPKLITITAVSIKEAP